jgi:hypothetical protein
MRSVRASVAISTLLLLAATQARAALLSLMGSSTLDLRAGPVGGEVTVTSVFGCSVTVPGISLFGMNQPVALVPLLPGGAFIEPAGLFTGTHTRHIPNLFSGSTPGGGFCTGTAGLPLIEATTIANVSNGTKSIAPGAAGGGQASGVVRPGGGLGGPGALAGTFLINVLGLFNLEIPLSPVGSTGAAGQQVVGSLVVTVLGTGWTTASVQVTGVSTVSTPNAAVVNTVTFVGYDNRTPGHVGRVLLVSPFKVVTNAAGNLPGIARQTLDFAGVVPEPGTLGLLVAGAAGLAFQGWRKRRR